MQDTYATKTATINSNTTTYPTGAIASGGSAVDEIDLGNAKGAGLAGDLWVEVIVSQTVTGTAPTTLDVTIESDDNTSFSSAVTRLTLVQITGTSGHLGTGQGVYSAKLPYIPERYIRFKAVSASGSTAGFGVVTFAVTQGARSPKAL